MNSLKEPFINYVLCLRSKSVYNILQKTKQSQMSRYRVCQNIIYNEIQLSHAKHFFNSKISHRKYFYRESQRSINTYNTLIYSKYQFDYLHYKFLNDTPNTNFIYSLQKSRFTFILALPLNL